MMLRRTVLAASIAIALAFGGSGQRAAPGAAAASSRLTDQEFWQLIEEFSEPGGFFRSENLVSNEDTFQYVIPRLQSFVKPGGIYVGVGPDQNYTYIAALAPRIAFIPDIRRGNLHVHLMYKALFELSADRAEFLSRLFGRRKPAGVGAGASPAALFDAIDDATFGRDRSAYEDNLKAILAQLEQRRGAPLSGEDRSGIGYVYAQFYSGGPHLTYSSNGVGRTRYPTFRELQLATDGAGVARGYLASEEAFRRVKAMHQQNLIVPLVGNFAGPRTLKAIAGWAREQKAVVTTFYTSNVEQYLFQDGLWSAFAANVAAMPVDETSTFIRSCFNTCASPVGSRAVTLLDSIPSLLRDFQQGKVNGYWDVLSRSR